MQGLIASSTSRAVIGAGASGRSMVRFLQREGLPFEWFDTRQALAGLDQIELELGRRPELGDLDEQRLATFDELLLSPGISIQQPIFERLRSRGVKLRGDVDLFARVAERPIAAITGSNGKSTVTALLAWLAAEQGRRVVAAGNIGLPVLDLLEQDWDLYVLELSSFQLETTEKLGASVACMLNMSPDHLDRYPDMQAYHRAKQRIYQGASHIVCNREDALTMPLLAEGQTWVTFGLNDPDLGQFGMRPRDGGYGLFKGMKQLIHSDQLKLTGKHNLGNCLAALAMAEALGLDLNQAAQSLAGWPGLPHRCQLVAESAGVKWVNDSKATNLGAMLAAIDGLAVGENLILIAGGQAKGQDFSGLAKELYGRVKQVLLIGEAAAQLELAIGGEIPCRTCDSLEMAVATAADVAKSGDTVLLSPACASFDMFSGFEQRGERFAALALRVCA